jgi:hypothetical protein
MSGDALTKALADVVAETVRTEVRTALATLRADLLAAVQTAPNRKQLLTVREARAALPGGVRESTILAALKSRALRGELRAAPGTRPLWTIHADDLNRWDAAGRPTKNTA